MPFLNGIRPGQARIEGLQLTQRVEVDFQNRFLFLTLLAVLFAQLDDRTQRLGVVTQSLRLAIDLFDLWRGEGSGLRHQGAAYGVVTQSLRLAIDLFDLFGDFSLFLF